MGWFWTVGFLVLLFFLAGLGRLIWDLSKRVRDEDGDLDLVYELIELILNALQEETGRSLSALEQAELEAAAREVYARVIANTPAAHLVDDDRFVQLAVEQWRRIATVEHSVRAGIRIVRQARSAEDFPY